MHKPGLAISRSMGDQVAHSIGVTNLPEVQAFKIDRHDKFIVIGSDGLWQYVNEGEVGKITFANYLKDRDADKAAKALL
jgi:serine/threonine protein phosphatase PrpC